MTRHGRGPLVCLILILGAMGVTTPYRGEVLIATLVLRSSTGKSLVADAKYLLTRASALSEDEIAQYNPSPQTVQLTYDLLNTTDFKVIRVNGPLLDIQGTRGQFQKWFGVTVLDRKKTVKSHWGEEEVAYFEAVGPYMPKSEFSNLVEEIVFPYPPDFLDISSTPVDVNLEDFLVISDHIAPLVKADKAHAGGIDGTGTKVAIVDTGVFLHPYFSAQGYSMNQFAAFGDKTQDEIGHGTGVESKVIACGLKSY